MLEGPFRPDSLLFYLVECLELKFTDARTTAADWTHCRIAVDEKRRPPSVPGPVSRLTWPKRPAGLYPSILNIYIKRVGVKGQSHKSP